MPDALECGWNHESIASRPMGTGGVFVGSRTVARGLQARGRRFEMKRCGEASPRLISRGTTGLVCGECECSQAL
jgi:hypothetical protein